MVCYLIILYTFPAKSDEQRVEEANAKLKESATIFKELENE